MDKPAKPPDRLEGQSAVSSAVCVQDPDEEEEQEEPGDREELEEYRRQEEDLLGEVKREVFLGINRSTFCFEE